MSQPPCLILLDDERETLAPAAMTLIRLGVEPLYGKWVDEARLVAGEAAERVGAAMASTRLSVEQLVAFRDGVRESAAKPGLEVLLVGPEADPAKCEALRRQGFASVLWEPFNSAELRFVVSTLLLMPEEIAPRREPRAAANKMCWLHVAGTSSFGVLYTVSAKGAYVEIPSPLPVGSEFTIDFEFDDMEVETEARVIYAIRQNEARGSLLACGLGCVFTALEPEQERALRERVARSAERHQLPALPDTGQGAGGAGDAAARVA